MRKTLTVDFFRQSPRAWEIRTKCIEALEILNELTEDPDLTDDEVVLRTRLNKLQTIGSELKELGVTANMNTDGRRDECLRNPVVCMEWAAGQVLNIFNRGVVVANQAQGLTLEFSETLSDGVFFLELKSAPAAVKSWMIQRQMVASLSDIIVMEEKT